jgi:hypothetical protein
MPNNEAIQTELVFGLNNPQRIEVSHEWYQDNLDIVFPLIIILAGLFQFIIRKWILPVSEEVISELENQLPSQGLIYNPKFGIFLIIFGFSLLALFNINKLF